MRGKTIISTCAAIALATSLCPPAAFATQQGEGAPGLATAALATIPLDGAYTIDDGVYTFTTVSSSTGMVTPVPEDGPIIATVKGDTVTLVLDFYNPEKYDGLWLGKREDAPADPYDASVTTATMVPAGDYAGYTNTWTDEEGLVGEPGVTYKAARFTMTMQRDAFEALAADGSDGALYFAVRRALWSPTNPGKWMGTNNNYLTLSGLTRTGDAPADEPDDPQPEDPTTPIENVKTLIDALPYDPYKVSVADGAAIEAANTAYEDLSAREQKTLDVQMASNGVLTYGRTLESALWAWRALGAVDDTTTLADGTYTSQVTSTCNMGKTTRARSSRFTVAKVVVKNGHAKATIVHSTSSPDTVSIGGILYSHVNADEAAYSTFEIPIDLNATFYLSQKAKNATENTLAIPYEMTTSIDEANAVPDAEDSRKDDDDGNGGDNGGSGGNGGKDDGGSGSDGSGGSDSGSGSDGSGGSKPSASDGGSQGSSLDQAAIGAVAASRSTGSSGGSGGSGGSGSAGGKSSANSPSDAKESTKASGVTAASSRSGKGLPVASADAATGEAVAAPTDEALIPTAIAILVLAVCGAGAFAFDFRRRERRGIDVVGMRLA